jgi:hypothetical protein
MEILLEILVEVVLPLLGKLLLEGIFHFTGRVPWLRRSLNAMVTALLFLVFGLLFGLLSIAFFPHAFVRSSTLPGISLLITPTLAGLVMVFVGWSRLLRGNFVAHLESFVYGFVCAFGMALIRFLVTK